MLSGKAFFDAMELCVRVLHCLGIVSNLVPSMEREKIYMNYMGNKKFLKSV